MPASASIYRHLTGGLLGGMGLILLAVGVSLALVIGQRLQAEYDSALLIRAQALVSLTEQDEQGVELDFYSAIMPAFDRVTNPEYFQLWLIEQGELARSPSLISNDLFRDEIWSEVPRFRDVVLPDGRAGRQVQIDFLPQIDQPDELEETEEEAEEEINGKTEEVTNTAESAELIPEPAALVVAREREQLDALLSTLYFLLIIAGIIMMLLVIVLVRIVVNLGLSPLQDIRDQVSRLNADCLQMRLQPHRRTEELEEMVNQFNALLSRLHTAFERERQFSADVAHELRTPLAELRNLSEVGGRWPGDKAMVQGFFQDVLDATQQMERIVVNLLALARCERGLDVIDKVPFDLVALINTCWQRSVLDLAVNNFTLDYQGPESLMVAKGRDQWLLMLTNVFSNALAYSPARSTIQVVVGIQEVHFSVSIANRAEQLSAEDLPLMFNRLWRKDKARSSGYHAGLGLTLVSAYAQQLDLEVIPELDEQQMFSLTLKGASDRHLISVNLQLTLSLA